MICIQESHVKPLSTPKLKNFIAYHKEPQQNNRAKGGVLTLINENYSSNELPIITNLQAIATEIFYPLKMTICNVYFPPNETLNETEINNLLNQLPQSFLLVGDFNCHNTLWGSLHTNSKGIMIEKVINNFDLNLMNENQHTHINYNGNFSAIDLSICSPILEGIFEWNVEDDSLGSDHYPIKIKPIQQIEEKRRPRWKLQYADWEKFNKTLNISAIETNTNINDIMTVLSSKIITAAKASIPKTKEKINGHRTVPWWNTTIQAARKERSKMLNIFKHNPTTENKLNFFKARSKTRYLIQNSTDKHNLG